MKTNQSRPISFEQAKAQFVHRFTMEHVPIWAKDQRGDGTFYAPQYSSDLEWYQSTKFKGESELADKSHCYASGQTWPIGKALPQPYSKSGPMHEMGFFREIQAAAENCKMLDALGEPYPNIGDCILWGQTAASLGKSTQEALEDACGPMLADMRDWLSDCQWRDEDADSIAEMAEIDIIRAVAKHYSGGLDAFQMATA